MNKTDDQTNADLLDDLELSEDARDVNEGANDPGADEDGTICISRDKFVFIQKLLGNIRDNCTHLEKALQGTLDKDIERRINIGQMSDDRFNTSSTDVIETNDGKIIEGVFDGENMIGPDGKQYSVPANYASKSKLVEGDMLKLTITNNGTFIYKQISPIERKRVVGTLDHDENGNFIVRHNSEKWRVLTASVTYYKGKPGDEVVVLVPENGDSNWAAVDNIVRNTQV